MLKDYRASEGKIMRKDKGTGKRVPRKQRFTRERMAQLLARHKEQGQRLAELVRDLDGEVEIDGFAMTLRGLKAMDTLIDNGRRAVREQRLANNVL